MVDRKKGSRSETKKRRRPSQVQTAYITLLSTADSVRSKLETLCGPYEITGQQYNVLRILRGSGPEGLPTLTIAERMIERAPGITRMIDRLEAKGLVVREVRPNDRRYVHCRITEKGMSLLELLDEPVEESNYAAFRGLSKAEIGQLVRLLEKTRQAQQL